MTQSKISVIITLSEEKNTTDTQGRSMNKYSLESESYDLTKLQWRKIKKDTLTNNLRSEVVRKKYQLSDKQVWFLYDRLLQEKYNNLYLRKKLIEPREKDYVYCNYDGYGRGTITRIHVKEKLMLVKFIKRDLPTMCSSINMCTVHDEIKRKITRL